METILGVPMDTIMLVSLGAAAVGVGLLLIAALRQPLLWRLAVRNPGRRPAQSFLVTMGLALSTIVVGTSFNTGDTITHTVRTLVASGLGRADEIVLALPREQRRSPSDYISALLNGTLLSGLSGYFAEEQAARLIEVTSGDQRIAGLAPAIGEQATVINRDRQTVQGQIGILALPPDYPWVFGQLVSLDGVPASLAELSPNELLANSDAAARLDAQVGSHLELRTRDGGFPFVVRGVVEGGELGGAKPMLYMPLEHYQSLAGRQGRVNQILVANQGDVGSSVRLSGEVSRSLRLALADRAAAAALFDLLRGDTAQIEIAGLARTAEPRQRQKLEALAYSLRQAGPSDDFISLAADPDIERRLYPLAYRMAAGRGGLGALANISPLRVVEIKQASQDQADRWGGALTSAFLILGLFSLATGGLLVLLIFLTLASERRAELGITRALGARRRDIIASFLLEGAIYDVLASTLGLVVSVLVALSIASAADAALSQYGVRLRPHLEPRSLVVAFCCGLLVTLLSIGYSSWRIGQLSVVSAIRNLPEPPRQSGRLWRAVGFPSLVVFGPGLAWFGLGQNLALPQAAGVALGLIGLGLIGREVLSRAGLAAGVRDRLAYSCCGFGLLLYWLLPADFPVANFRPTPRSIDLFFLAGISMVLGAVWVVMFNLTAITRPLVAATAGLRDLGLAVRTAAANPLQHRFTTGLTVAMFALVILNMVVAAVLLTATHRAYSDPEALSGGFDVRAELAPRGAPSAGSGQDPSTGSGQAFPDLASQLDSAPAVRPDDFAAIGRLASRPGQVLELGPGVRRWRSYTLQEVDSGFISGLRSPLAARADGFGSDAEVWEAVRSRAGLAVVGGSAVGSRDLDGSLSTAFRFASLFQDVTRFQPIDLWVRDERGGRSAKLTVVGVLDARVSFGPGVYANAGTFESAGAPLPQRVVYYFKASPWVQPEALVLGLNISFGDRGLRAATIGDEVRRVQSVRELLNELLQRFFGIGLLAGLAALGVISLRTVVERRQQIGVLRALGFRRHVVRLSLLLETSLVGLLGIGLGVLLGLALARRLVDHLGRQYPEIIFSIPWEQIGLIVLSAYLSAMAMAALPLWRVGRIEPARALRYE